MKGERLIQERSVPGRALAAFEARTVDAAGGTEERAWQALQARLAAPPPARRWAIWPAAALGASAAAALVVALSLATRPTLRPPPSAPGMPSPSVAAAPPSVATQSPPLAATPIAAPSPPLAAPPVAAPPVAAPAPAAEPPPLVLAARPRLLPAGAVRLAGGSVLVLGDHARAQGSQQAGETRLVLESGTLKLAVAPGQPEGASVRAGPYRFVDLGTVFRVTRASRRVSLWVDEGRVAVWRGRRLVATVNAGGRWSSPAAPAPAAARVAAPDDPIQSCAASLADRGAREALVCYRRLAAGSTLIAETARYQEALVLLRHLRDLPGALAALHDHRRRFPRGALRAEADLTLVELLPRLGRFREALDESGALLARDPRHERAAELHLLRGNILRESFRDPGQARLEYAAVRDVLRPGEDGDTADDAAFFEAVCLEASGRDEAADAYRRYLARGPTRHAAAARARLSALAR